MKKENRTRGIPYLDSIDLEILEFLDKPNYNLNRVGWSILDLAHNLNITHISLKPHIDKLLRLRLIVTVDISNKANEVKVGLSTIKSANDYWISQIGLQELSEKERETISKEKYIYENIFDTLTEIRKIFYDKEKEKLLDIDLRKLESQDKYKREVKKPISKK